MNAFKLLLAVCIVGTIYDPSVLGRQDGRCQCINTSRARIPIKRMAKIEVFRKSHSCNYHEVIVTKRSGVTVCLDPTATWVVGLVSCALPRNNRKPGWHQLKKCTRDLKKKRQQQRAERLQRGN
ncbi:interleukin-8-like [Petromyzon marinus]|uniref:interleukin-8-like n=1 Tax=Petromyzon marinus TaxID=7757 RepID=UPI003F72CA7F